MRTLISIKSIACICRKITRVHRICHKGANHFPNSADIPWYIGDCYSIMMEPEKAIEYLKKAHELNPKDVGILTSIAWEYYSLEDYAKASEYAERLPKYLPMTKV